MKLLFDQNISFRIVKLLSTVFPNSTQVRLAGLEDATDIAIWEYAKANNFVIVTFDADFYDISLLRNHPPKIVWLRAGNLSTQEIAYLLTVHFDILTDFYSSSELSCLELR